MSLSKYQLEISVFVASASVMIFELVGSRLLAPYFGTSLSVWSNLIGVILASMSFGYYFGGRLADIKPTIIELSQLLFGAAISIFYAALINDNVLSFLQSTIGSVEWGSLLGAIILFTPASIFLGMISPYVTKMKVIEVTKIGTTVGNISTISTVGSIFGTFLAGLVLIPKFGTTSVLLSVGAGLLVMTVLLSSTNVKRYWKLTSFLLLLLVSNIFFIQVKNRANQLVDIDTAYNRVWIRTFENKEKRKVRTMSVNHESHSSMYLDSAELVYDYTKFYHLAGALFPNFTTALMLGGAGYSFPKSFLDTYPSATIDVVEIDPGVTELAKKYFNLRDNPRLRIYHEDGRVFLNRNTRTYDVILGDAFSSRYSVPYQLTTQEAVRRIFESLTEKGIVILNLISGIEGDRGMFLKAELKTYQSVFPFVEIYPVNDTKDGYLVQNIILIAAKNPIARVGLPNELYDSYLAKRWVAPISTVGIPIITDKYAPIDYYMAKALE